MAAVDNDRYLKGEHTMASDPNANITKNQVSARQGTTRPKLIYVLVASVALVIILFVVAWLVSTK